MPYYPTHRVSMYRSKLPYLNLRSLHHGDFTDFTHWLTASNTQWSFDIEEPELGSRQRPRRGQHPQLPGVLDAEGGDHHVNQRHDEDEDDGDVVDDICGEARRRIVVDTERTKNQQQNSHYHLQQNGNLSSWQDAKVELLASSTPPPPTPRDTERKLLWMTCQKRKAVMW